MCYALAPGETAREKFQAVKAAGFEGIEPPNHLDQHEVLHARDETGLAIPSVSCGQRSRKLSGYLGWPEQWIRNLGPRIQKLHIKEFSRKKMEEKGIRAGFTVEYLEGDSDWPAVMKAVDEAHYRGWAIAEPAWQPKGVAPAARLKEIAAKVDQILAM
jgi:sugar phosphate isomerase/epimerase